MCKSILNVLCVGVYVYVCVSAANCKRECPKGRPSEDCSRCVCEGHVLQGEVLSMSGVPVAGARIALASQPKIIHARTDSKGLFRLPGVCSSSPTQLYIHKEKFAPITASTSSNSTGSSWVRAVLKSAGESRLIKLTNKRPMIKYVLCDLTTGLSQSVCLYSHPTTRVKLGEGRVNQHSGPLEDSLK